jgi:hypothetical protein
MSGSDADMANGRWQMAANGRWQMAGLSLVMADQMDDGTLRDLPSAICHDMR